MAKRVVSAATRAKLSRAMKGNDNAAGGGVSGFGGATPRPARPRFKSTPDNRSQFRKDTDRMNLVLGQTGPTIPKANISGVKIGPRGGGLPKGSIVKTSGPQPSFRGIDVDGRVVYDGPRRQDAARSVRSAAIRETQGKQVQR